MNTLQMNLAGRQTLDVTIPKNVVRIDISLAPDSFFQQSNDDDLIVLLGLSSLESVALAATFGGTVQRLIRQPNGSYIASEPLHLNCATVL